MYHISFFRLSLSPTCSAQRCTTLSRAKLIHEFRLLGLNENTNISQCPSAQLFREFYPLNFLSFARIPVKSWQAKASEDSKKNTVTRMQNDDVEWHRLNVHSKQGFVPHQFWKSHIVWNLSSSLNHILACSVWLWRITTPRTQPYCKTAFTDTLNWNIEDWHLCFSKQSPVSATHTLQVLCWSWNFPQHGKKILMSKAK
jgi:hypothetical protein